MNPSKPKLSDFYRFIYERHKIWYRRNVLNSPPPWTEDKILSKHKFCNVYRELDRCTIHLIDNVINSKSLSLDDKIFNIILYRRFNTPDFFFRYWKKRKFTLNNFRTIMNWLIAEMDINKSNGLALFNNSYIICQRYYTKEYRKGDKHVQQIYMMNELRKDIPFIVQNLKSSKTYEDAFKILESSIPLTGPFLAQQYLIDITYLPEFRHKWDINSFVDVGPGAKPAARSLINPEIKTSKGFENACKFLYLNQSKYLPKNWSNIYLRNSFAGGKYLRLSDIQNCLCEFRKYCHLQTNPNKKKRYYKGAENGLQKT